MNKEMFLAELKNRLKGLPADELEDILKYYNDYFDEAGVTNEQKVINELKSPANLASKILSDYAEKEAKTAKFSATGSLRALWFTILGIFAAPIAVPFALLLTIIILALCLVLICTIFLSLFGGGILTIVALALVFTKPGVGIMLFGVLLVATGLIKILWLVITAIIKKISYFVKKI